MPPSNLTGSILVADDNTDIRRMLAVQLTFLGHTVTEARDGQETLDLISSTPFDLVLLDLTMPKVTGFGVLEIVKDDPALRHLPIIVISAAGELKNAVRSIELGAEDFLSKPFETSILKARIGASLERKRLRDNERAYLRLIEQERATSERLLLNVLPKPIADRLRNERRLIVDQLPAVTVLFADIADFTLLAAHVSPDELIEWLNDVFSAFDDLANTYGLEKIKTIGDAYMAAAGLPTPRPDHAEAAAAMALGMLERVNGMTTPRGDPFHIRIGMDSGPVVAGVIGTSKFSYDLWGDAVNTASRMEAHGLSDRIQVTPATYELLSPHFQLEARGLIPVKGKGDMQTYWLLGRLLNGL
jgi:adenylate cyclase